MTLPDEVHAFLNAISPAINLHISGLGLPLQCLGLHSFSSLLIFTMTFPVVVCGAVVLAFTLFSVVRARREDPAAELRAALEAGLLQALPSVLAIGFLVFPIVSSLAFQGLELCDSWRDAAGEETYSFLKADYEVDCNDPSVFYPIRTLAIVAIGLYPVGIPAIYLVLLRRVRETIMLRRSTRVSEALGFLHRDFEPVHYYWEVVELLRKLLLVGFVSPRGAQTQD